MVASVSWLSSVTGKASPAPKRVTDGHKEIPLRLLGPPDVIGAGVRIEAREVTGEDGNRGVAQGAIHRRRLGVGFRVSDDGRPGD